MAESVVGGAPLLITENLVRLLRLLEVLLGLRVVGIAIRVPLHRELAVGLLDGLVVGIPVDAEHFVVIPLRHSCCGPRPR